MRSVTSPPSSTTSCGPLPSGCGMAGSVQSQYSASERSLTLKSCFAVPLPVLGALDAFAREGGSLTVGIKYFVNALKLFDRTFERAGLVGPFPGNTVEVIHFPEVTVIGRL